MFGYLHLSLGFFKFLQGNDGWGEFAKGKLASHHERRNKWQKTVEFTAITAETVVSAVVDYPILPQSSPLSPFVNVFERSKDRPQKGSSKTEVPNKKFFRKLLVPKLEQQLSSNGQ